VTEEHSEAPPAGEEIHLPGPTVLPVVMAVGITFTVIGTTITWLLSVLGVIIFLVTLLMWIRHTRRDISELPEDHSAH
jgi:chromate transport protein ChrA